VLVRVPPRQVDAVELAELDAASTFVVHELTNTTRSFLGHSHLDFSNRCTVNYFITDNIIGS
jgi:hypothetical protein